MKYKDAGFNLAGKIIKARYILSYHKTEAKCFIEERNMA
jgi:hypothetical protein